MFLSASTVKSLLIIKHGALGDIIKALGACRILRTFYSNAQITLLTTPPYRSLCQETGYFDHIITDPRSWNVFTTFSMIRTLAAYKYDFVIDLQNSKRTNRYFKLWKLLNGGPWSGTATNCQYPIDMTLKNQLHIYDRFYTQMQLLGIKTDRDSLVPSLEWVNEQFPLAPSISKYALLIPGSSPVALKKRWPADSYTQVSVYLVRQGITPIIIGGKEEQGLARLIQQGCPEACDFTQKTSLQGLGSLAKRAIVIIGNDTGPTYLASAAGSPTIVLWSNYSDPLVHAPRGKHITILQQDCLADLPVERVVASLKSLIPS